MKILILGAGATGGYFGGRLIEGGADVTFLVRPRRHAQLERDGLRIESPLGDLNLRVKTVAAGELRADYDLVVLTCKAYDLDSALEDIAPAMRGKCAVLPFLNGLAHFEPIAARFGGGQVIGGTCSIKVALRPDGVIHHADRLQRMAFGERDRSKTARAERFAAALRNTKIDWEHSEDIEQNLWEKIVFLSALAATTSLFRAHIGEIIAAPGGLDAIAHALEANIEIATREGRAPRPASIEFAKKGLTDPASTWTSSMLIDLEAGARVESDHIVGWMLDRARKHGIEATVLSIAYTHLKAYEARRAAGRLPGSHAKDLG